MRLEDVPTTRRLDPSRRRLPAAAGRRWSGTPVAVWVAIAAVLVVVAAWLMYETRGTTLWFDEWQWASEYRDDSLAGFLAPHNGHPTLVPVAIYRLLFATVGIAHSAPYRAIGIAGHLACVLVLYVYAVRRSGTVALSLLIAASLLFLGPGWQNIVWALQIGWLISIGATLGALLMLDRRDRLGDVCAAVLGVLAMASSGPGVVLFAGIVLEVLLTRGRRGLWIVVPPLVLLAAWWIGYQDAGTGGGSWTGAPGFAADMAAATVSAIAGLAGPLVQPDDATLGWGRPLAVVAAVLVVWRLWSARAITTRALTLLVMLGLFWLVTAVQRTGLGPAASSRYVYVGAAFVLALAAELVRGVRVTPRAWLPLGVAAVLVLVANAGDMRAGASFLRDQGLLARSGLAAIDVARPLLRGDEPLTAIPGYPYVVVRARDYFAMERDLGTPAATLPQLMAAPESVRLAVDGQLAGLEGLRVRPGRAGGRAAAAPHVDASTEGSVVRGRSCVRFAPAPASPAGTTPTVDLTVPPGGIAVTAGDAAATVALRRFAAGFPGDPMATIAPHGTGRLAVRHDLAPAPWHVRLASAGRVTACGLAAPR